MASRREHDNRPDMAYERHTDETFDAFLFVPGTYAKPWTPERLRVVHDEGAGLVDLLDERATSEERSAETVDNPENIRMVMTSDQVRWLHRTLGSLVARWDASGAHREDPPPAATCGTCSGTRVITKQDPYISGGSMLIPCPACTPRPPHPATPEQKS